MAAQLVLLHSPLVGPQTWSVLAPVLRARGNVVSILDYSATLQSVPHFLHLARNAAAQLPNENVVLIAHSAAGALVPAINQAGGGNVKAAILCDALLPNPGKCWFETVPETMVSHLRSIAADGYLPPWNQWWPEEVLKAMLPENKIRTEFIARLPSLPLTYVEEPAPDIFLPANFPVAYLQLSPEYDREAHEAQGRDWATERLSLGHLAMLTHPEAVASALGVLIAKL